MINTKLLRTVLALNSAFSALSGITFILWPNAVASLVGVTSTWIIVMTGAGLLIFSADLLHQVMQARLATWRALYASMADMLWVILSVILIAVFHQNIPAQGTVAVLAVAGIVFFLALLQLLGIHKAHLNPGTGLYRHCLVTKAQVPAQQLWPVIANLQDISRFMPMLAWSEVLDNQQPQVGAIRRCQDQKGRSWCELCTDWQEGQSFALRFLTTEPGFPFPATEMYGGWSIQSTGESSEVTIWWELAAKPKWLAPVMLPMLAFGADRDFPKVIERMCSAVQHPGMAKERSKNSLVRLLPALC